MPRHDHFMLLFAPSPSWSQGVTTAEGQGQAVETGVPPMPLRSRLRWASGAMGRRVS
jgi:hypothetical protein